MLNVKNPEAHRLAKAISEQTGESLTKAVIIALRERLERLDQHRRKPTAQDALAAAALLRSALRGPAPAHPETLYGEHGLPR